MIEKKIEMWVDEYILSNLQPPQYKEIAHEFKISIGQSYERCKYFRHKLKNNVAPLQTLKFEPKETQLADIYTYDKVTKLPYKERVEITCKLEKELFLVAEKIGSNKNSFEDLKHCNKLTRLVEKLNK